MCTPSKSEFERKPCGFANFPKRTITLEEIPSLSVAEKSFTEINFSQLEEFSDYLKFPTLTLKKGTDLCHSAAFDGFYDKQKGINLDTIYWWNEYFPGQSAYKGGWFTYETSYGGPNFGLNLYYRLQDDLTLPFIPNDFVDKYRRANPKYFSIYHQLNIKIKLIEDLMKLMSYGTDDKILEAMNNFINIIPSTVEEQKIQNLLLKLKSNTKDPVLILETFKSLTKLIKGYYKKITSYVDRYKLDMLSQYAKLYSGSHMIEGVEDWEAKGYKPLEHPTKSYADNLALRVAELGFNGYISCDECEVYITHAAMKRVLTKPHSFDIAAHFDDDISIIPIIPIIRKSFELPHIPLVVTKSVNRQTIGKSYIPVSEFRSYLETPEKFI